MLSTARTIPRSRVISESLFSSTISRQGFVGVSTKNIFFRAGWPSPTHHNPRTQHSFKGPPTGEEKPGHRTWRLSPKRRRFPLPLPPGGRVFQQTHRYWGVVPGVDLPVQFTFKCAPCLLCRIKDNTGSQLDGLGVFPVAAAYGLRSDDKGGIPDQLFKPFIFHICLLPASQPCSFGSITSIVTSIVVFIFLFSFAFKSAHRKWIKMKDSSLTALNKSRIRNPFHFLSRPDRTTPVY